MFASVREMSSDPSHLPVPCLALTVPSIQGRGSSIVLDALVSLSLNHLGFTSFTSQRLSSVPRRRQSTIGALRFDGSLISSTVHRTISILHCIKPPSPISFIDAPKLEVVTKMTATPMQVPT
ncbi:hypothetical protein CUC08_Gglean000969 [Alternaria sp. MG1]|nr:hypothetical protein CUC08_Gglean000969 [Alternaria sp. MG1]